MEWREQAFPPTHTRSSLGSKPEAMLQLYVGDSVEAKLDAVPSLYAPLTGEKGVVYGQASP
jgi:hypothetical protein